MGRAEQLTAAVMGKTVSGQAPGPGDATTVVDFEGGGRMALAGTVPRLPVGRTIRVVRQTGAVMHIDFDDGSSSEVGLQGPTSSVQVEDASGRMTYFD